MKKKDGVEFVYSSYAYHKELRIARLLFDLDAAPVRELSDDELSLRIRELEERENLHLDELQKEAVRLSAFRPLLLITGGPGTGKTDFMRQGGSPGRADRARGKTHERSHGL